MNRAMAHRASLPLWCVVLLLPSLAWGQAELRSGKKGATNPAPVTSTSIDADHQALDVNVAGGTLGNVTISNADGAINDGVSNTIKATVLDLTNSNPVTTAIVDSSGNQITSFGGGTQYQQGDASTTTDTMTMAGCVRVDTPAVAAGVIDGDRARCMVDSTGRLWVHVGVIDGTVGVTQSGTWNIATLTSITNPVAVTGTFWQATQPVSGTVTANAGSGNFTVVQSTGTNLHVVCDSGCSSSAGFADNGAFTFGTTAINPIGGVLDDTSTNTATENSAAVARITAQKALHMNLRNNSGTEIGTSGAPVRIDPTGSTTQPISAASLPLPTGAATAANQDGIIKDGTGDTTQANVSGGSLHVACQSGCSGGTQYAEDTVHSSGDQMTMAGVVRSDAAAALAADGDRTVLQVDANGYLKVVNINPNLAADNSTLSTSKVPVLPGTVSTSAPTWTNGNQSALSLQTDGSVRSAVTNTVTVTASNLDVQIGGSDSLTIGTFPDNEPFNVAQMNGVAVSMGVGASGTGTQRVASLIHDGTDTAQVTATAGGSLQVECTSGCGGSGGTSIADDAAFTPGTTSVTPAGAMFDDVTPDSVNEGDAGVLRMSANRNLYSTIRDAAGNERGANVNASNQLEVAVGTFPDNEPFNVAQINGVTPLMGAGNTGTGSLRVTVATDQAALNGLGVYVEDAGETAGGNLSMAGTVRRDTAASSAGSTGDNATLNTDATGLLWTRTIDPCSSTAKTFLAINISTATTTEITPSLAGASTNYYVCSLVLVTAAANNVALVDDDSDGCGSVTSGLAGGTSAASGFNMAANSGMTFGNGMGAVFKTNGTNRVVCLVTSANTQLSGTMTVVAAP